MVALISEQEVRGMSSPNKKPPSTFEMHPGSELFASPHDCRPVLSHRHPFARPCSSLTAYLLLVPPAPSVRRATLGKQALDPATLGSES